MTNYRGSVAVSKFIEHFGADIETVKQADALPAQIIVPTSTGSVCVDLQTVSRRKTVGDKDIGVYFTTTTKISEPATDLHPTITLKPDTDLGFLIESQALPILRANDLEYAPIPVFDIASFVPHNPGHHDVNFIWTESITDFVIANSYKITPGGVLFNYVESLSRYEGLEMAVLVGERARLFKPIYFDQGRMHIPSTCSRPAGQKMHRGVVQIDCSSSYLAESGQLNDASQLDNKPHLVDERFMKRMKGKAVGIIDDLDATRHTLAAFIAAVEDYGGYPIPITVNSLKYVYTNPDLIRKGLIAPIQYQVASVFIEHQDGRPVFTKEMKDAWRAGHRPGR